MNKIYKVIWNAALRVWVVASELARGKVKSASASSTDALHSSSRWEKHPKYTLSALALSLLSVLVSQQTYAIDAAGCAALGTDCVTVSNATEFAAAIGASSVAKTILLTADITLTDVNTSLHLTTDRANLVVDGGGYKLTFDGLGLNLINPELTPPTASLTVENFGTIASSIPTGTFSFIYVNDASAQVAVKVDNIGTIPDGMLVAMGNDNAGVLPNNSPITIGNITTPTDVTFGAFRQVILGSNITFTGKFYTNQTSAATVDFPGVLWTNGSAADSLVRLTNTADVKFTGHNFVNGTAGNLQRYSFQLDDNAKLTLDMGTLGDQNVFGLTNNGLEIGTYNPVTGFGPGAVVVLNTGSGNGISNEPSTVASSAIYNGPGSTNDVIYNLAENSEINSTTNGIVATKNASVDANIYIRNAGTITAGSGGTNAGIYVTHNGSGEVKIENANDVSAAAAIRLHLAASSTATATLTNSGSLTGLAISGAQGLWLDLLGSQMLNIINSGVIDGGTDLNSDAIELNGLGVLQLSGGGRLESAGVSAIRINYLANSGDHTVNDTTIGLAGTAKVINKYDAASITFSNTTINANGTGTAFDNLTNVNFDADGSNRNTLNVTSTGTGIGVTGGVDLTDAVLDLNVSGEGTGMAIAGDTANTTTLGTNTTINATNGTAINFTGTGSKSLINNGIITGTVTFADNITAHTITNNNTFNGNLTTYGGDDTLTLAAGSTSTGTINLGNGDNSVTVSGDAAVDNITTGNGADTFTLADLTNTSQLLGVLDAGGGSNTLNFTNSTTSLAATTQLSNFATINLNTTALTLANAANISAGTMVSFGAASDTLNFANTYNGNFAGVLSGAGASQVLNGAAVTLTQDSSTYTGNWAVASGGTLTASNTNQLGSSNPVNVAGILNLNTNAETVFNNALTGAGQFNVNTGGNALTLASSVGNAFAGEITLTNTSLNLKEDNKDVLQNATLTVGTGGNLLVGEVVTADNPTVIEQVGNLKVDGGTLTFYGSEPQPQADFIVNTQSLTVTTPGIVDFKGDLRMENHTEWLAGANSFSILAQNAGEVAMQLIDVAGGSSAITGWTDLALYLNGEQIDPTTNQTMAITQGGETVANGIYNYSLTDSPNHNGLYINFGLVELQLLEDDENALQIITLDDDTTNATLTTKLTGSGGIIFDGKDETLTVSNDENSYEGTTIIRGNVKLGESNSFGNTSLLQVDGDANLSLDGHSQKVGGLNNNGTIDLAGGELILAGSGAMNGGSLKGDGELNVNSGTLNLDKTNNELLADIAISDGAVVNASADKALGSGGVAINDGGILNLTVDQILGNNLSGGGEVNTNAKVKLSGDNSGFSGSQNINADGELTVSEANNLGNAESQVLLNDPGAKLIFDGLTGEVAPVLKGNGQLVVQNESDTTLTGDNSGLSGNISIKDNSKLTVSDSKNLGSGEVNTDDGSSLVFDGYNGELSNKLTGDGTWSVSNGSDVTLNNENGKDFSGKIDINGGSALNFNPAGAVNDLVAINIAEAEDSLNIQNAEDFTFNNALSGNGVLNITTNNNKFAMGEGVGEDFNGTLNLNNTVMDLAGSDSAVLARTTLELGSGSSSAVPEGGTTLGGVVMSGGALIFDPINNDAGNWDTGTITTSSFDINESGGDVLAALPDSDSPPSVTGNRVLALDESGISVLTLVQMTGGNKTTGSADNLTLNDIDGNPITAEYTQAMFNSGNTTAAATGTFGFGLSTGVESDGLYVAYLLKQLALSGTNDNALILEGLSAVNATEKNVLKAKLTGHGDVAITGDDANAIVIFSNDANDYDGQTLVRSGTLQLGADNALGGTSNLVLDSGTTVKTNGYSQTVGKLNTASGSTLILGGSAVSASDDAEEIKGVTVGEGGVLEGNIEGNGPLTVSGETLVVNSSNGEYTGTTTIGSGAGIIMKQNNGLGTGVIKVAGTLHLDGSAGGLNAATLLNALQGSGSTTLSDAANVTLRGDNSEYSGTFTTASGTTLTAGSAQHLGSATVANSGTLVLDTDSDWQLTTAINGTGNLVKQGSGTVTINDSLVSAALTTVSAGELLVGTAPSLASAVTARLVSALAAASDIVMTSDVTIASGATYGSNATLAGNLTNAGTLKVGSAAMGGDYSDFVINGNYVGNGGNIELKSVLGNDDSQTDRLVITGNSSGTGTVSVTNMGGLGAITTNGIEIIEVAGTSDAVFTLKGRATAGIQEYFLYQGTPTAADGNWYLRSGYGDIASVYTPEAGGMVGNIAAAQSLFNTRLSDLVAGRAKPDDGGASGVATGELRDGNGPSSLWLRQVRARTKSEDDTGQLASTSNRYVAELGGEVFDTSLNGEDRLGLGVMAGYGRATGNSRSKATGFRADNKLTGYTAGVYGTWYADAAARYSPYIHGLVRYDWFNATVNEGDSYRVKGFSATLEGGYPFQVYQSERNQTYIIPQVQLTYNGAKMDDQNNGGAMIQQSGKNNIQTRLGARLTNDTLISKSSTVTTYLDVSWIQDSRQAGVQAAGQRLQQAGNGHAVEVRVGVEGQLNHNLSVWGTLGQQMGPHGYDDKAATLGVKYSF